MSNQFVSYICYFGYSFFLSEDTPLSKQDPKVKVSSENKNYNQKERNYSVRHPLQYPMEINYLKILNYKREI